MGLFGPDPRLSPSGVPLPPEVVIQEFITSTLQNPYLSDEQRSYLINSVQAAPETLGASQSQRQEYENTRRATDAANETEAQQRATQTRALEDLGGLERQGNSFFDTQINRFVDPATGGIRSDLLSTDPTFANAISAGDAAINANIGRVRSNAVLSQSGTGSNFSGKATTAVGNAENAASGQRGANRSTLFQRANDLVFDPTTGLMKQRLGFQEGVNNARTDINSGLAPNLTGLQSFSAPQIDYSLPYQQQFGEEQTGFGRGVTALGILTNLAGSAADTGLNAANIGFNAFKGGGG